MRYVHKQQEEEAPKGFDLTVTHRDPHTGLITHRTPYILRVSGEGEQRSRLWERPSGSGNLFDKDNNPIGRWVSEEKVIKGKKVRVGKHDPDAAHIAWEPPLTEDQKLARRVVEQDARIAALEQELRAIGAEKEKNSLPSKHAQKKDQGS